MFVIAKYMAIKNETTKKRIIQFVNYKEISVAEFIRNVGLKRGVLDSDKLESSISDVFVAKIIATFPELDLKWLLLGEGNMFSSITNEMEVTKNIVAESRNEYINECKECKNLKEDNRKLKEQINLQNKLIALYENKNK